MEGLQNLLSMAQDKGIFEAESKHRELERYWRELDEFRRELDAKMEQLKALSEVSALIAGFAMITMVEVTIPDSLDPVLLCLTGMITTTVIALMIFVVFCSIFLLNQIYTFAEPTKKNMTCGNCHHVVLFDDEGKFHHVNNAECIEKLKEDGKPNPKDGKHTFLLRWSGDGCNETWKQLLIAFMIGMLIFPIQLGITGWVVYWDHQSRNIAATIITVIGIITFCILFILHNKYSDLILGQGTDKKED